MHQHSPNIHIALNMAIYEIHTGSFMSLSCVGIKLKSKIYFQFKIYCNHLILINIIPIIWHQDADTDILN